MLGCYEEKGLEGLPHGVATKSVGESRHITHLCKLNNPDKGGDLYLPATAAAAVDPYDLEGDSNSILLSSSSSSSREIYFSSFFPLARLGGLSDVGESKDGLVLL